VENLEKLILGLWVDRRFEIIDKRFIELEERLNRRISEVDERLNRRIDEIGSRLRGLVMHLLVIRNFY